MKNVKSQFIILFQALTNNLHVQFHPGPGQCLCPHTWAGAFHLFNF